MARSNEGLRSDLLQAALREALAGKPARLEEALAKQSRIPSPRPNLELAAAFGAEAAAVPGPMAALLTRLGADDAAPDDPRVFLPVVAAHGWAGRIRARAELEAAWVALEELAADERKPVRLGTLAALTSLASHAGGADELVERALGWLQNEDGERRLAAAALALEALGDNHVLASLQQPEKLLEYLSQVLQQIADAPRAAERWDGRRRALLSLPTTIARAIAALRAHDQGGLWFEREAATASHPDVRAALSEALAQLRRNPHAPAQARIDTLRGALEASQKPLRDAARVRPGTGRGRRSRHTR